MLITTACPLSHTGSTNRSSSCGEISLPLHQFAFVWLRRTVFMQQDITKRRLTKEHSWARFLSCAKLKRKDPFTPSENRRERSGGAPTPKAGGGGGSGRQPTWPFCFQKLHAKKEILAGGASLVSPLDPPWKCAFLLAVGRAGGVKWFNFWT